MSTMSLLRYYLNSLESLHLQEPDPGNSLRNLVYKQDEPNARHKQANICARYPELPEQNAERFSTVRRQGESFHLLSVIRQTKPSNQSKRCDNKCIIKLGGNRMDISKHHTSILFFAFRFSGKGKLLVWIVSYHCLLAPDTS